MSAYTIQSIPVFDKAIWPKAQIKIMVKDAIDRIGGRRAFDAIGPTMRRAIICQEIWHGLTQQHDSIGATPEAMRATEKAFCEAAGIWD